MLSGILVAVNGLLGYKQGKETGIAGLIGIVATLFLVSQWNKILPIVDKIGLIDWLDRLGIIQGEATPLYILFLFSILLMVLCALILMSLIIVIVLGLCSTFLFETKAGEYVAKWILGPFVIVTCLLLFPIIYPIYYLFNRSKIIEAKQEVIRRNKIKSLPVVKRLEAYTNQLDLDQSIQKLNGLPFINDKRYESWQDEFYWDMSNFVLGVTKGEEIYLLIPRPALVSDDGLLKKGEFSAVRLIVSSYDGAKASGEDRNHNKSYTDSVVEYTAEEGQVVRSLPYNLFVSFYDLNSDANGNFSLEPNHRNLVSDFKRGIKTFMRNHYQDYCHIINDIYSDLIASFEEQLEYTSTVKEVEKNRQQIIELQELKQNMVSRGYF
ncbi:hypothetical protein [Bacillus sp. EB01]|uniref:hypothetical protein n=1 Tax=Bacillus sp. EB01 TaxID=1347086 RepID=UPI0005C4ACF1|nr:hypothetical protein [Bacillus sp. EB01]